MTTDTNFLHLKLTVRNSRMALPRCVQALSRRGFVLRALLTQELDHATVQLRCTLEGPIHWHDAIPRLLQKNIDVLAVERVTDNE